MNNSYFFIPLIIGLVGVIIGFLIGKLTSYDKTLKAQLQESESINRNLQRKISLLENDMNSFKNGSATSVHSELESCKANTGKLNTIISSLHTEIHSIQAKHSSIQTFAPVSDIEIPFDAELASSVYGKTIKQDDLKIVEGIGLKTEHLFHEAGITTWKSLSETPLEKLQLILAEAGESYAMHNPSTWAKQSLLAYQGKWNELKDWQASLDGGKE